MVILPNDINILLFNVYMSCDTDYNLVNLDTYSNVLHKIDEVCMTYHDVDNIIIGGDFNTDISRTSSRLHHCLQGFS